MSSLGYDPADNSSDVSDPAGVGTTACQAVLDFRHSDGSNQLADLHSGAYSDYTGYAPANRVGSLNDFNRWQPLLVNGVAQTWQVPHWGRFVPFALTSGSQFRSYLLSRGPFVYPSSAYLQQALDVIDRSARLGDREKVVAEYWADGVNTVTPPGHWNLIAVFVSRRDKHTLDDDVKLFFILGNALLDTSIATGDIKRYTDSVRPITVIRFEMGNRKIQAWAGPRSTFTAAADEAGISRRYGGIHFENDDLMGRELGRLVAATVWEEAANYIEGRML
jgi:hypothetical protein